MAKEIWLSAPDPNGSCCGCEGKNGPCDSCCEYTQYPQPLYLDTYDNQKYFSSNVFDYICESLDGILLGPTGLKVSDFSQLQTRESSSIFFSKNVNDAIITTTAPIFILEAQKKVSVTQSFYASFIGWIGYPQSNNVLQSKINYSLISDKVNGLTFESAITPILGFSEYCGENTVRNYVTANIDYLQFSVNSGDKLNINFSLYTRKTCSKRLFLSGFNDDLLEFTFASQTECRHGGPQINCQFDRIDGDFSPQSWISFNQPNGFTGLGNNTVSIFATYGNQIIDSTTVSTNPESFCGSQFHSPAVSPGGTCEPNYANLNNVRCELDLGPEFKGDCCINNGAEFSNPNELFFQNGNLEITFHKNECVMMNLRSANFYKTNFKFFNKNNTQINFLSRLSAFVPVENVYTSCNVLP